MLDADHAIGARVIAALRSSDWAVPIASRSSQLSSESLRGVDGIVNCAGGTAASILACARAVFPLLRRATSDVRIVQLSSITLYGSANREVNESSESSADLGAYAAAHIEAERLASHYPPSVILRLGCEYGPACLQWSERVAGWLIARRVGNLGAAGEGRCNLLYVDDLAAAVIGALTLPHVGGQVFNLAMSSPPTWNEYFEGYARVLGAAPVARIGRHRLTLESKLMAPPLKALEIIARRLHLAQSPAPLPIPPSVIKLCRQQLRLDVGKAEAALGMQWTALEQGLRNAAAAFQSSRHFA